MCGIVGYVGSQEAVPILIAGLAKLEYRGYDSAGVAVMQGEKIEVRRSVGKLANLQKSLAEKAINGVLGIGHTRWATHGKPSEQNAHPHRSNGCVLVHNGIIENYQPLKQQLQREGYAFQSETDTEVVAHLIDKHLQRGLNLRRCRACSHQGSTGQLCPGRDLRKRAGAAHCGALRLSARRGAHEAGIVRGIGRHGDAGAYARRHVSRRRRRGDRDAIRRAGDRCGRPGGFAKDYTCHMGRLGG